MNARPRVAILLATYQGERFLSAQLDSLVAQSCRDWRLVVSDDGSTDATLEILRRFAASHPDHDIELRAGPRRGVAGNFLSLLDAVAPEESFAWCDQDDIWLPDRLARGLAAIAAAQAGQDCGTENPCGPAPQGDDRPASSSSSNGKVYSGSRCPGVADPGQRGENGRQMTEAPACDTSRPPRAVLHVARTTICHDDLRPIRAAPLYARAAGFRNALVQACTPGNTMLIDPAGAALLRQGRDHAVAAGVISHDWWSYLLIAGAGGAVIRDPAQTVLYRQHGGNVMGRNDTPAAMMSRLARLGSGDYADWLRRNIRALIPISHMLTPENAALLERFDRCLDAPGPAAAAALMRMGIYRQTRIGSAALLTAAAAGLLAA